jgi:L-rhamnose mutarotase
MRYCFLLQVDPDLLEEYKERHVAVWPRMLTALRESGWHHYSIFARDDGLLVGYVEADDLDQAQRAMERTDVNARWQAEMARFFGGARPDQGFRLLDPIFNLEDQLAELEHRPAEPTDRLAEPTDRPAELEHRPEGPDGRQRRLAELADRPDRPGQQGAVQ